MSFEASFRDMLEMATTRTVYWDTTPPDFAFPNAGSVHILQQTGGKAAFFVEKDIVPSHKNARVQVTTIGRDRATVMRHARQVEDIIAKSAYPSEPFGAPVCDMDPELKFFQAHQQFGVWFADP